MNEPLVQRTILCGVLRDQSTVILIVLMLLNKQICIFGDFNARTGSLDDMFLIDENICNNLNFDRNMFTDQVGSKPNMLPSRSSMDKKVNNYGRRLIELCKN